MSATDDLPDSPDEESYWNQLDEDPSSEVADWAGDELEEAYLKAMEVLEASSAQFPELVPTAASSKSLDFDEDLDAPPTPVAAPAPVVADRLETEQITAELQHLAQSSSPEQPLKPPPVPVTPRQILEALLFVGGELLTTKRLSHVLRGEFSAEFIETQIEELNALYLQQGRPYEIRFGDGGYRMTLRDEFEKIRRKVFGLGPKEVRLTQEALEVLAVLAYHQPITATAIEELGKPGCSGVLRQLLRRELICVERTKERPREVQYRTTPRFLSLFGIRNLNELPRLEQVSYK